MLTIAQVAASVPQTLKGTITQALVDRINNAVADPVVAEHIRDNFLTYSRVLQEGRYKTEDYLNAVMYVSHKLMGCSNREAYERTFPVRYGQLLANGASSKDISAYVSMYSKGKLVNLILEQSLVPTWVLNQDSHQKAINTLVELMTGAQSEKVRCDAATSILVNLAKPKEAGPLVNIDMRETSGMSELRDNLVKLAQQQQQLIAAGVPAATIAAQRIIEADNGQD